MALKLWLGGSGSGKSHELYQYVIRESQRYPETNYIVIVPEQFTLQTQRDLVMMHPRRGIMNIDVLSFNRLAYRVFDEVGGDAGSRQMMDDMGKSLVLRRIAAEHASELKILGKNLKKLGYINEIKSIISEFMQYNIKEAELDTLLAYVSNRPMLQYKLQDIKLLYQIFMDYMKDRYTTKEELLATLSSVIDQSEIVKKSVIVFDGFTGFTPIQNQLLSKLMTLAKDIHVTVLLRNAEGLTAAAVEQYKNQEQELFYLSYKTIASLSRLAEETQTKQEPYEILPGNPVYR
ncbi:MAG: helicase-exonuclease AddAB subunit AddB, partial [bacterium]|nr:helicase-exonuclease AddAB subunit AddB [bacterium]